MSALATIGQTLTGWRRAGQAKQAKAELDKYAESGDSNVIEKYLRCRYVPQVVDYRHKESSNTNWYSSLQVVVIVLSTLTTFLLSTDLDLQRFVPGLNVPITFKQTALVTSLLVSMVTTVLKLFNYHDKWVNYHAIREELERELHFYRAGVDGYATNAAGQPSAEKTDALFVKNVEAILARGNSQWTTLHTGGNGGQQHGAGAQGGSMA